MKFELGLLDKPHQWLHRARQLNIKIKVLILGIFLSLGAAGAEGLNVGLLAVLMKGVFTRDFAFFQEMAFIKKLPPYFSFLEHASTAAIFFSILALVLATTLLKHSLVYSSGLCISSQITKAAHTLRRLIFHRYLRFGKMFFDRHNMGWLQTLLLSFPGFVVQPLGTVNGAISQLFMLGVYFAVMFWISWKLTLCILIVFPALHYSVNWLIKKLEKTGRHMSDASVKLSGGIANLLACIPLVKLYKSEQREDARFSGMSSTLASLEFSMGKKNGLLGPIQDTVLLLMVLSLVSIMAVLAARDKTIEVTNFLIYLYVLRRAQGGFGLFNQIKASFAAVSGATSLVNDVFNDNDKFFITHGDAAFGGLKEAIELRHLSFSYIREKEILKDVSFRIEKGKMTAIVGPTGSGKTTIVSLLLRFYDCPAGTILADGRDIRDFTLKSLMPHFAYVGQDTLLFNDTIRNNILYGLENVPEEQMIAAAKKARLYDLISGLPHAFDTEIGDRGVKLSGGEKQRLSIARALLKNAEVLILDEATSSLDSKTERLIQEAIDEAVEDRTAIVIAHRLSTIKHADKILVIENGQVAEEGTLDGLLAKQGKFYQYWQEQKFY
jgi:subfamily B ATP-binding cassette protein MsbA